MPQYLMAMNINWLGILKKGLFKKYVIFIVRSFLQSSVNLKKEKRTETEN